MFDRTREIEPKNPPDINSPHLSQSVENEEVASSCYSSQPWLGAGAAASPVIQAARLNQATGGQLARAEQPLLHLQRQYGNRYVQRVMTQARPTRRLNTYRSPLVVQPKMILGPVGDKFEQEADRIAQNMTRGAAATALSAFQDGQLSGQQNATAVTGTAVNPSVAQSIEQARGRGETLNSNLSETMGQRLGADFSRVRIHTGHQADGLNQILQARAFTTGQDIFFRRGEYNSSSQEGQALLAHELAHVVQQSSDRQHTRPPTSDHLDSSRIQRWPDLSTPTDFVIWLVIAVLLSVTGGLIFSRFSRTQQKEITTAANKVPVLKNQAKDVYQKSGGDETEASALVANDPPLQEKIQSIVASTPLVSAVGQGNKNPIEQQATPTAFGANLRNRKSQRSKTSDLAQILSTAPPQLEGGTSKEKQEKSELVKKRNEGTTLSSPLSSSSSTRQSSENKSPTYSSSSGVVFSSSSSKKQEERELQKLLSKGIVEESLPSTFEYKSEGKLAKGLPVDKDIRYYWEQYVKTNRWGNLYSDVNTAIAYEKNIILPKGFQGGEFADISLGEKNPQVKPNQQQDYLSGIYEGSVEEGVEYHFSFEHGDSPHVIRVHLTPEEFVSKEKSEKNKKNFTHGHLFFDISISSGEPRVELLEEVRHSGSSNRSATVEKSDPRYAQLAVPVSILLIDFIEYYRRRKLEQKD